LVILLVAAAAAWWFRDDIHRWIDRTLHPAAAAARIGHPTPSALSRATAAVQSLSRAGRDSVVLGPDEVAALLVRGTNFLPGVVGDSLTVELEERAIRIRTVVDSARIPAVLRDVIPGRHAYEAITVEGSLTPVRPGVGEFQIRHATVRGVPLPANVVSSVVSRITGHGGDGRMPVSLPPSVGGFRIRSDGMTVYRGGVQ
ncbi:MAG: hypothetical protein ACRENC_15395, partial [Gemmatimonadaceae bacterium]